MMSRRSLRMLSVLGALALPLAALTACGDDGAPETTGERADPTVQPGDTQGDITAPGDETWDDTTTDPGMTGDDAWDDTTTPDAGMTGDGAGGVGDAGTEPPQVGDPTQPTGEAVGDPDRVN